MFDERHEEEYWLQVIARRSIDTSNKTLLYTEPIQERITSLECIEGNQGKNEDGELGFASLRWPLDTISD